MLFFSLPKDRCSILALHDGSEDTVRSVACGGVFHSEEVRVQTMLFHDDHFFRSTDITECIVAIVDP